MPVAFDHDRIELLDPGVQCPGGVRRSSRPVRKNETSRSICDDPASILLCPTVELGENCAVAGAGRATVGLQLGAITMSSPSAVISKNRSGCCEQSAANSSSAMG